MLRNVGGLALMLLGPWLVWLSYAHLVRPIWRDPTFEDALLGLAFLLGCLGAISLGSPFTRWSMPWKVAGLAAYAAGLAVSLPLIALMSVCTTGDCL
jgi:hypothetical protein